MKIAIIGSGISGLGAAYLLHKHHDITVYEKNDYLGGHSRTVNVPTAQGDIPVDTGFIVFNHKNYPNLVKLFQQLNVKTAKSDMSFGVSLNNGALEYGSMSLRNMFAQKRNLLRPHFYRMLRDILKFNKNAETYIGSDLSLTLKQCLDELKLGDEFRNHYLYPMGAAIWSTPTAKMQDYPAHSFLQFFKNHGLLTISDHPQWYTVVGGSKEYVSKISAPFFSQIQRNVAITAVERTQDGHILTDQFGQKTTYDHVIFACHSDQTLNILKTPTNAEFEALSSITYQPNHMVLHKDSSFMPKRKSAWSSWVYLEDNTATEQSKQISLSYWMNNLQPLATQEQIFVTLNPAKRPSEELIFDEYEFHHPKFDEAALNAQKALKEINGQNGISFCGAYLANGFHEDGLASAVEVTQKLGCELPW